MNLDRVEIFLAVIDAGTLSAASHRVHLTQPAISRNLKLLEEELGVSLFERSGRVLRLTDAGRALVPKARRLIDEVERLEREVKRSAERRYFDVRIGSVDSIVSSLVPKVIGPLRSAFPHLWIKLRAGRTQRLLQQIADNELDLAIVAYSGPPPGPRVHNVGSYDLQFYGRADLFPKLSGVSDESELDGFPIVEIESLPGQPTLISGDAPSFAVTASLASVKALILGGFGVGALLDFTLTAEERESLARASVPHDPECALFVVGASDWTGGDRQAIEVALVESLREVVRG